MMINAVKGKLVYSLVLSLLVLACLVQPAISQAEEYTVHIRKDFGYGWGGDIQGRFTISLVGEEKGVEQVSFLIDGKVLAVVSRPSVSNFKRTTTRLGGTHYLLRCN